MGESISSKSPFLFFLEADLARSSAARATNSFQISLSEGLPVTAGPLNYFNKNHVFSEHFMRKNSNSLAYFCKIGQKFKYLVNKERKWVK